MEHRPPRRIRSSANHWAAFTMLYLFMQEVDNSEDKINYTKSIISSSTY